MLQIVLTILTTEGEMPVSWPLMDFSLCPVARLGCRLISH